MLSIAAAAGVAGAYAAAVTALARRYPEPRWDWAAIDLDDLAFPPGFLWGTSTAAHQVDGGNTNNNWSRWETQTDDRGRPRIQSGDRAGRASEHWTRYEADFDRMVADLGVNAYRFSLEWSRVEPEPGRIDPEVVAHYHRFIDAQLARGVQPMLTLHHFSEPLWFADRGGFEREENVAAFVRYAEWAFREFGDKVPRWNTFNEPGPFATMGWGLGVFPPGKKDLPLMARVLGNLMLAHHRAYAAMKALPGGARAQIGLAKNIFQFDPWRRWSLPHWGLCRALDAVYNESILGFLREGIFELSAPGWFRVRHAPQGAAGCLDFIGLNYYSNLLISPLAKREPPFVPLHRPGQILTDMPYATYPEGFYRALMRINQLGVPVIVTENGIADARDDRREDWIRRYAYAMSRAIRDGCDLRGFHYWSLLDNFEWAEGYAMRFGLYEVDYETQERRLRRGSRAFAALCSRFGAREG